MKGYAYAANYTIKEDCIIDEATGWDVMSTWETPIMQKHADIVCANGGHILEFGFGMGISADLIQEKDIESHTIIEINDGIYDALVEWAKDKPNVIAVKGNPLISAEVLFVKEGQVILKEATTNLPIFV